MADFIDKLAFEIDLGRRGRMQINGNGRGGSTQAAGRPDNGFPTLQWGCSIWEPSGSCLNRSPKSSQQPQHAPSLLASFERRHCITYLGSPTAHSEVFCMQQEWTQYLLNRSIVYMYCSVIAHSPVGSYIEPKPRLAELEQKWQVTKSPSLGGSEGCGVSCGPAHPERRSRAF